MSAAPADRRPKVLLTGPIDAAAERRLRAMAEVVLAPDAQPATLRALVADADVVLVRSALPGDLFEHAPRLRGVVRVGVGVDMIPVAAATARGLPVANVPGSNAQAVAEHVLAALGLLTRRLSRIDSTLRRDGWAAARALADDAGELGRRTLGLVGVGHIGQRVAAIAHHGYGMRVLGHQRRLDALPPFVDGRAELDTLLADSDAVVLCCPLTDATRGLLDARRLRLMKPGALLVNVSRGAVVDEAALVDALRAGALGGAALDVFETQPLAPDHPLLALDNVLLTPHAAGLGSASLARMSDGAVDEALRLLRGEPPLNRVS